MGDSESPWWQRTAKRIADNVRPPAADNSLSYGELRQLQDVGNTDSPTNQMAPNIVSPDKQSPALSGVMPQPKVMKAASANGAALDAPKVDSYEKMLEFLKAQQVADADADRRARRREMMAAIGDGISAISSLYQTTQGAPVTYTPGRDMSEAMRQRFDRMTAQRKADSDKYLTYLKMQHAAEQDRESQEYRRQMAEYRQQQLDETARSNKEREEMRKETLRLQQEREERISKVQDLNIEMKKAKDPGLRIYYGTKAERIADGWPEEKAEAYALAAQEEYNQQQKAQEAARKAAQKKTKKRSSRRRTSSGSSSGSKKPYGTAPGGL